MTDFLTLADFRASLQRQHDAYGPMIEDLRVAERIAAARVETAIQAEAIQAAQTPFGKIEAGLQDALAYARGDETRATVHVVQSPRQRQDVRGPVLALLRQRSERPRDLGVELSIDNICEDLPSLKRSSIIAALRAAVKAGQISEENEVYYIEQPSRGDREERPTAAEEFVRRDHEETGGPTPELRQVYKAYSDMLRAPADSDPPTLAVPSPCAATFNGVPLVKDPPDSEKPYHGAFPPPPPDPRTLTDTSPESQAKALRAAVERAGPAGLSEENACVDPAVIAAGAAAGWLNRDDGRLWIAEQEAAQ